MPKLGFFESESEATLVIGFTLYDYLVSVPSRQDRRQLGPVHSGHGKGDALKKQKGRENTEVVARSLLCFWAARELGLSLTELARQLEMTVAGIGYAVRKGEKIARENHYRLLKEVS